MKVNQAAVRGQRHGTGKYPDGQPNLSDTNAHSAHNVSATTPQSMISDSHTDTSSFEKRVEVFSPLTEIWKSK